MKTKEDVAKWLLLLKCSYWRIYKEGTKNTCANSEDNENEELILDKSIEYFIKCCEVLPDGNYIIFARTGLKTFANEKTYNFAIISSYSNPTTTQEKIMGVTSEEKNELQELREYKIKQERQRELDALNEKWEKKFETFQKKNNPDFIEKISGVIQMVSGLGLFPKKANIGTTETEVNKEEEDFVNDLERLKTKLGGEEQLVSTLHKLANFAEEKPEIFFNVIKNL